MKEEFRKIVKQLEVLNYDPKEGYVVENIPFYENHKIGLSIEGNPIFFIKIFNSELTTQIDYNLELISIRFNCNCNLKQEDDFEYKDTFTIIQLHSENEIIVDYFSNIILLVISRIGNFPDLNTFKKELNLLIELFGKLNSPSKKAIQGLWGELFMIEQSKDPLYLIKSWHVNASDTFDFNDGIDKLEVKSTINSKREHIVSNSQLFPSSSSILIFCSILLQESGQGITIFDLINKIETRLCNELESINKLHKVIFSTLGNDIEKSAELCFDYNYAKDNLLFFDHTVIPKIHLQYIPPEISDIKYKCNFSELTALKQNLVTSKLLNSLI
jgi:hypothetical protein